MFPKLPKEGDTGLGEVGAQLQKMETGCCFVRIEKDEAQGLPFRMVLPLWRHPGSVNLMVDKDDRKAMLLRLFNEMNTEIINHVAEKAKAEQRALEESYAAVEMEEGASDAERANEAAAVDEEQGEGAADVEMDGEM